MPQSDSFFINGLFVDIENTKIYPAEIYIKDKKIVSVSHTNSPVANNRYILPGFIDAHVHVESSMLVPSEFARLAVVHGTVSTVSDPHEIANVCGMKGVEFMLKNGETTPFKFNFGAPSCVPATNFETAGATLTSNEVEMLLQKNEIKYLSEMMNFPGVLFEDEEVMKKIAAAHKLGKPVDGHAPGLMGENAKKYAEAGISTDHECFTEAEALGKLACGMKILIREGSAAKNFAALAPLLHNYWQNMMFCSDDKHPDSLVEGHINTLCSRAVQLGVDVFKVLQAACINPVKHYGLSVGLLQPGDPADFIVLEDLTDFKVKQVYIEGTLVAENGVLQFAFNTEENAIERVNNFNCSFIKIEQLELAAKNYSVDESGNIPVIEALDGQLITNKLWLKPTIENSKLISNTQTDVLKMAVVNRYFDAPVAICFIKNFGLKAGAIASSVAHDSHNIVAVGVDDQSLYEAINLVIKEKGGITAVGNNKEMVLPLPIAGLMSDRNGYEVAERYTEIDRFTKLALGSTLASPFMTLSFMALLVIPHLKLSDKGLFDGDSFSFIE